MAASDQFFRSQRTLDVVFGVTCLLLLGSTVWMFAQDYYRPFKAVQRTFRDVETALGERDMLNKLPDLDAVEEKRQEVNKARKELNEARDKVRPRHQDLLARRERQDETYRGIKA